jgi:hypothetical protein
MIMSKNIEKIKNQLSDFANVINSFRSEAVQVRIVDHLLDVLVLDKKDESKFNTETGAAEQKSPGATKMVKQLLPTDFFNVPRSISEIVTYCNEKNDADVRTSEFSGVLLSLIKQKQLKRERNEDSNRFEYMRVDM